MRLEHELPGRARFRAPSLDADSAALIRDKLPGLPGVEAAEADPRSGGILVRCTDAMSLVISAGSCRAG